MTSEMFSQVGVYGYEVDSHFLKDGGKMPVVMTVEPSARSKILTVHSPFFVLNQTPHTIEHVFRMNPGLLRATTNSSLSAPLPITLMPNQGHYLPVSAGAGGHLKARHFCSARRLRLELCQ